MAIETYQFMSKDSVKHLLGLLFKKSNLRIDERIVSTISEASTDNQVLNAAALYDFISTLTAEDNALAARIDTNDEKLTELGEKIIASQESKDDTLDKLTTVEDNIAQLSDTVDGLTHLTMQVVVGDITTVVTEPKNDVMYLQKDSVSDPSWSIYVYTANNGWVMIGDTEVDLSNYWTKDDITDMQEALGMHNAEAISDDDIVEIAEACYAENAPDLRVKPAGTPVITSTIAAGTALSTHPISGDMTNRAKVVPGTFSWVTTDEEFTGTAGDIVEATWMFTPTDTTAYAPVTGVVALTIV